MNSQTKPRSIFITAIIIGFGLATGFALFSVTGLTLFTGAATALTTTQNPAFNKEKEEKERVEVERAKREQAWQTWYKKPQECQSQSPTWTQLKECANNKIRKEREFEALYQKGQL